MSQTLHTCIFGRRSDSNQAQSARASVEDMQADTIRNDSLPSSWRKFRSNAIQLCISCLFFSHLIKNSVGWRLGVQNRVQSSNKEGGEASCAPAFSSLRYQPHCYQAQLGYFMDLNLEDEVLVGPFCLPEGTRDQQLLCMSRMIFLERRNMNKPTTPQHFWSYDNSQWGLMTSEEKPPWEISTSCLPSLPGPQMNHTICNHKTGQEKAGTLAFKMIHANSSEAGYLFEVLAVTGLLTPSDRCLSHLKCYLLYKSIT